VEATCEGDVHGAPTVPANARMSTHGRPRRSSTRSPAGSRPSVPRRTSPPRLWWRR